MSSFRSTNCIEQQWTEAATTSSNSKASADLDETDYEERTAFGLASFEGDAICSCYATTDSSCYVREYMYMCVNICMNISVDLIQVLIVLL